jgi:hypothetical protein
MDLNNKTHLYAIGCSHMAGSEIEGAILIILLQAAVTNSY